MAELDRLLGFMSSWDRQAAMKKYQALFDASADTEALIEELGTPTKLSVALAASYVPSPSPSALALALEQCPVALEDLLRDPGVLAADLSEPAPRAQTPALQPETWVFEQMELAETLPAPEAPAEEAYEAPTRRVVKGGALALYLIPAIVIGLPVAAALVCLGIPFLAAGVATIFAAVLAALRIFGHLQLISDMLLTGGAALVACAVGLLLSWFGLWLSMELCWLWVGKALCALGRRLCVREEAA